MNEWTSKAATIVDGHVHMGSTTEEESMMAICKAIGVERTALVSIQDPGEGSGLPQSLYMKARYPERFYVFAGLNHAERLSEGRVVTPSLADQVDGFMAVGCEGIKMIEGKPTSRQRMDVPVTDPYFEAYWSHVEELGLPIVWHVADPEEFWDPAKLPAWAKQRNWGYGPGDVPKETLYSEVDAVLSKFPNLRIVFAHFYFLSADLPRAGRFLDAHPSVSFDLTPGVEMLYNCSRDPDASRRFFIDHADQIVFGTDLFSKLTVDEGRARAGIVFRWLESDDTFRVPDTADFLLGPPEDGVIRGMSLPEEVLNRIYSKNLENLAGTTPRPLDVGRAIEECERIGAIAEAMSSTASAETEAGRVAKALAGG